MPKESYVVEFFPHDKLRGVIPNQRHYISAFSPLQAFTGILRRYNALYLRDDFTVDEILARVRKVEPEGYESHTPNQLSLDI